jgi:hypothetical protein
MRSWGGLILVLGLVFAVIAMGMDTSVDAGGFGRVNNIGLMKDQQNYLMVSGLMVLLGFAMMVAGGKGSPSLSASNKKCPECAETIQAEAKVCRYCGNRDLPTVYRSHQPKRTMFDRLIWDRTQDGR